MLRGALALALTAHLAVAFLPLPSTAVVAAPESVSDSPNIVRATLPPPPLVEPTRATATPGRRKLPIPMPVDARPVLEPVDEPVNLPPAEDDLASVLPEQTDGEPPPPSGPLPEWTEDLALPVRLPGHAVPVYPPIARRIPLGGRVVLQVIVEEEGRVTSVEVVEAPGADVAFSKSAVDAVSRWLYRPGSYRGRPVAVRLTVVVEFSLN